MKAEEIEAVKIKQEKVEANTVGRDQLRNWGLMIRSEPWPGPKGSPPCPMFKDYKPRYPSETRESRGQDSFNADDAYMVMDLIEWLIHSESEKLALYLYWVENSTAQNFASSVERYNVISEKKGNKTIGESKFRLMLGAAEERIGTAYILCRCDKSWQRITKELAKPISVKI